MKHDGGVVVTGLGVISTIGETADAFFDSLIAGRAAISRRSVAHEDEVSVLLGDLSGFDLERHLTGAGSGYGSEIAEAARKSLRNGTLSARVTAAAACQAVSDAGLLGGSVDRARVGHVLGGHNLVASFSYDNHLTFQDEPEFIDPLYGVLALDTDVVAVVCEILGLGGPSLLVGGACASGNVALVTGLDLLRAGRADAVVVTGALADVDPVTLHGWAMVDAISYHSFNDEPNRASRPFDARREGFVPSHAAAAVVLETEAHARARGAPRHALLLGGASASDASRLPKPRVAGQVRAMRAALADAGVTPGHVDYVNAHAASTQQGDAVEVESIKEVFGPHAFELAVNGTKSVTGHCLTAAGVIETVATVMQIERGVLHPTINQEQKDAALDLDFVPNVARERRVDVALSNSFGFGGLSTCVVVGRAT
jgi:3-oxoacyl-(acyl-carrier-protein) synthase